MSQKQPPDSIPPEEENPDSSDSAPSETEQEQSGSAPRAKTRPFSSDSRLKPPGTQQGQEKTRPMAPYDASEAGGSLPDLDEAPRSGPVDEVQEALFEAARQDAPTEVDLSDLPEPIPDLDEGPRPGPVDEVQEALFEAAREGTSTELEFEQLPGPGLPSTPKKVVKFRSRPVAPQTDEAGEAAPATEPPPAPETVPLPDFPEPDPAPTVSDFWLLLPLFVLFRLLILFLLRPGGFIRDWSDFDTYFGIAALSDYGLFPFLDFWLEWPPLVPWLSVGAYRLSLWLPPWSDDARLWFILILGAAFVLFEIGNFVLIYRLARKLFSAPTTISRVLWLYAGLFPPIYAMLGFFDGIALFFILLALDLLLDDRRFSSAIAVGAGFMVKIIPGLMLPVALRRLWYQYQGRNQEAGIEAGLFVVVSALTALVLLVPFLIAGPEWVLASARSMLGRASWETVWALFEGYYGFGAVLGDRLNPAETDFAVHTSALPWLPWLATLAFGGLYAFIFTRRANYSQPRQMVAFGGLTIAIFMLYSKGYSPQFLVYILPFILLLFPDGRGLTYALILTGLNVLEQPIYFVLLPAAAWLLTFTVIARFLLLTLLALEFALVLWPLEALAIPRLRLQPAGLAGLYRRIPLILAGLAGLSLLLLTPLMVRAYTANRLAADDPIAAFSGFMQAQTSLPEEIASTGPPRLLLSDQATYRQLYPHLSGDFDLQLTDGPARFSSAPGVLDLLQGYDAVWILPTGPQQQALRSTVTGRSQLLAAYEFEGLGTASLHSFQGNVSPFIAPARFATGIELLAHRVEAGAGAVDVTLYWRALEPQSQSLTVFTQLLDAEGQWVAGHDSIPANGTAPTNNWTVNAVQADPHHLTLPADLPPGEYTLIAGLYNDFNERLRSIAPSGLGFANRAVPLEVVRLP